MDLFVWYHHSPSLLNWTVVKRQLIMAGCMLLELYCYSEVDSFSGSGVIYGLLRKVNPNNGENEIHQSH